MKRWKDLCSSLFWSPRCVHTDRQTDRQITSLPIQEGRADSRGGDKRGGGRIRQGAYTRARAVYKPSDWGSGGGGACFIFGLAICMGRWRWGGGRGGLYRAVFLAPT